MELNRNVSDYNIFTTRTSFSFLLELANKLINHRDLFVLVGGWVPHLLLKNFKKPGIEFTHIGSIDIDLALHPELFSEGLDKYHTLIKCISELDYAPKKDESNRVVTNSFTKNTEKVEISIDLLTKLDPNARIQKACDIAFEHNWECPLIGNLPNNDKIQLKIRAANIVSGIVTKAYALVDRTDGKDFYDIYAMITYYKNGPSSVATEFKPYVEMPDISQAIEIIDMNFKDLKSNGPLKAAPFLTNFSTLEKAIRDVYENVKEFLSLVAGYIRTRRIGSM